MREGERERERERKTYPQRGVRASLARVEHPALETTRAGAHIYASMCECVNVE